VTQISDIEPAARRRLCDTPRFASVVPFDGVCNQRNALMRFVVHAIRTGIFGSLHARQQLASDYREARERLSATLYYYSVCGFVNRTTA